MMMKPIIFCSVLLCCVACSDSSLPKKTAATDSLKAITHHFNLKKGLDTTVYYAIPGYEVAFVYSYSDSAREDRHTPVYLEKGSFDSLIPCRPDEGVLSRDELYRLFKTNHICADREEFDYGYYPITVLRNDSSLLLVESHLEKHVSAHYHPNYLAQRINGKYRLIQEFKCSPCMTLKKKKNHSLIASIISKQNNNGGLALIEFNEKKQCLEFVRFLDFGFDEKPVYPGSPQSDSLTRLFHSQYKKELVRKM